MVQVLWILCSLLLFNHCLICLTQTHQQKAWTCGLFTYIKSIFSSVPFFPSSLTYLLTNLEKKAPSAESHQKMEIQLLRGSFACEKDKHEPPSFRMLPESRTWEPSPLVVTEDKGEFWHIWHRDRHEKRNRYMPRRDRQTSGNLSWCRLMMTLEGRLSQKCPISF